MKLDRLIQDIDYKITAGNTSEILDPTTVDIKNVVNDNRKIEEGSLFICIKGANFDGHSCATQAYEAGAAAIVVEHEVDLPDDCRMAVIRVDSTRYAMAFISAAYFDHPAAKLKTIGITGTKGKTTTTYLIRSMLENAGHKVGLIGTIEVIIGDEHIHAENTTPESYNLQEYMARMVEAGCDSVVMEVSSQGLMLHRSQGFTFDIGIFTNIEADHIGPNEHKDFDDYMHCKGLLFKQCKVGICNGDDVHTDDILEGHTCQVETYGFNKDVDIRATNLVKAVGLISTSLLKP